MTLPPDETGITYTPELADGLVAKAWGVPVHIWETFPLWSRAKMAAIVRAEAKIAHAGIAARKQARSNESRQSV